MKYLKYPLLILLGIIVTYLILCFLGPKDLDTTRSAEILAPASISFNLANSLKKSEKWNEWTLNDTTIVTEFNNIESGVGASSSWTSKNSGDGTQTITESVKNEKITTELNFKGWDGPNIAEFLFRESDGKTNVTWSFDAVPLPFLFRGFGLITGMKKMMESNYEKGLANLKKISEERASGLYNGYQLNEELLEEKHFVMYRQEVNEANMQQFYATNLGNLFAKVQEAEVGMNGMPCGLFFRWAEEGESTIDMAASIPLSEPLSIEGASSYSIPSRNAVILDYYGDYQNRSKGHDAIEEYMKDRGLLQDPPLIEEYVTDPGAEPDPGKWLTRMTQYYSEG